MKIDSLKELGTLIRKRRKSEHLTIEMLSALVPCSPRLLGEMERGIRNVSFEHVLSVCTLLGIDIIATEKEERR